MVERVLVFGGRGFLGRNIVTRLLSIGYHVRVFDLPSITPDLDHHHAQYIDGDITDNQRVMEQTKNCDYVFHCAAMISFWDKQKPRQFEVNIGGTKNILKACEYHLVKKIIYTSTVSALGYVESPEHIGDEETQFNWGKFSIGYHDSKNLAQTLVDEFAQNSNLQIVSLLPGTIFGRGHFSKFSANHYFTEIKSGKMFLYPKGGTNCVSVEDVVEGHIQAIEKGVSGEKYILGGENLSYKEIFETIAQKMNVQAPRFQVPHLLGIFVGRLLEILAYITKRPPLLTSKVIFASANHCYYSSKKAQSCLDYSFRPFTAIAEDVCSYLEETQEGEN